MTVLADIRGGTRDGVPDVPVFVNKFPNPSLIRRAGDTSQP